MNANESYDEKLFIKPQSDHLKCPICFNIMKDPVTCRTQGHTFCRHCVTMHLDQNETCPTCREPLKKKNLIPSRLVRSLIEDKEVHCFSHKLISSGRKKIKGKRDDSCDWSGKLSLAEGHYNECQFAEVTCPHIGCDDIFLRSYLLGHIESCLHRLVTCQWCNIRKKIDLLDEHLLVCRKRPIPCPNSCLDVNGVVLCFNSSEIKQHRIICSMESICCRFVGVGCETKLTRKDMPLHENDGGAHIGCLLDALQTAQVTIRELKGDQGTAQEMIRKLKVDQGTAQKEIKFQGNIIGLLRLESKYTELIYTFPVSELVKAVRSTNINVSGHNFFLTFQPKAHVAGWHSLFLHLVEDTSRLGPVNVEAIIDIVSNSELHPSKKIIFDDTYLRSTGYAYGNSKYMETTELNEMRFVKDECITLRAKIFIKP